MGQIFMKKMRRIDVIRVKFKIKITNLFNLLRLINIFRD